MNCNGLERSGGKVAAVLRAVALALAIGSPAGTVQAQDSLPSVSDYRLPSGQATPRVRPQGPIDADNPVVPVPRPAPAPADEAPAAAGPDPDTSAIAPAAPASPRASPAARPAATPASRIAQPAPPTPTPQSAAATAAARPDPAASAPPVATVTAPISWNIHSAREVIAAQSPGMWPWLAALAFGIGVAITLLLQNALRRRRAQLAESSAADWAQPEPEPVVAAKTADAGRAPIPAVAASETAASPAELDLLVALAAPEVRPPAPAVDAGPQLAAPSASRPSLDLHVNPLDVVLAARRMSATLLNAVLSYELIVCNRGTETIGPVTVGGDMIGAHATLPDRAQLEMSGNAIVPLHRLASLAPGESITLSGEFKLPLAAITPIRSGNAALFVPLARFRVEAARPGAPPLAVNSAFVIGEDQERPGAALRPFRLDLGPRLYSRLGQRELALSA